MRVNDREIHGRAAGVSSFVFGGIGHVAFVLDEIPKMLLNRERPVGVVNQEPQLAFLQFSLYLRQGCGGVAVQEGACNGIDLSFGEVVGRCIAKAKLQRRYLLGEVHKALFVDIDSGVTGGGGHSERDGDNGISHGRFLTKIRQKRSSTPVPRIVE